MLQCMLGRGIVERTEWEIQRQGFTDRERSRDNQNKTDADQQQQALFAAAQQHRQRAVEKQWLEEQKQWANVMTATTSLG